MSLPINPDDSPLESPPANHVVRPRQAIKDKLSNSGRSKKPAQRIKHRSPLSSSPIPDLIPLESQVSDQRIRVSNKLPKAHNPKPCVHNSLSLRRDYPAVIGFVCLGASLLAFLMAFWMPPFSLLSLALIIPAWVLGIPRSPYHLLTLLIFCLPFIVGYIGVRQFFAGQDFLFPSFVHNFYFSSRFFPLMKSWILGGLSSFWFIAVLVFVVYIFTAVRFIKSLIYFKYSLSSSVLRP